MTLLNSFIRLCNSEISGLGSSRYSRVAGSTLSGDTYIKFINQLRRVSAGDGLIDAMGEVKQDEDWETRGHCSAN